MGLPVLLILTVDAGPLVVGADDDGAWAKIYFAPLPYWVRSHRHFISTPFPIGLHRDLISHRVYSVACIRQCLQESSINISMYGYSTPLGALPPKRPLRLLLSTQECQTMLNST